MLFQCHLPIWYASKCVVVVYCIELHRDTTNSQPSVIYNTVTGLSVMTGACGMALMCGSTIKGPIAISKCLLWYFSI